ncbi:MAG: hypothetical protein K2H06_01850 [Anaeroplasmataceae bacterium]|nr:hypothetical protein [Anaeroplasmataceae bacterium]
MSKFFIEPQLNQGKPLMNITYLKNHNIWILQGFPPVSNNLDEYEEITLETALSRWPEINDFISLKLEKNIRFQKGINSGTWYDFILE